MEIPRKWTRDEAIEVCLAALATGCVHGVSANHDPDVLTTGTSFSQHSSGVLGMWRSWDLFEAHFGRWQADLPWRCEFLMVQSWRIRKPPKFSMLRKELHRYGYEFATPFSTGAGSEYRTVAASGSRANIDRDNEKYLGRVMNIYLPAMPPFPEPEPPDRLTSAEYRAIFHDLDTIARAPERSWPAWLDRRRPAPDDLIQLLDLLRGLHLHLELPGRSAAWGVFGRWLLEHARSFWPADEWAWRWSDFVVDFPGLAAPGEVAAACLAALPMTAAEAAALPSSWRSRTPDDVRRERVTLALLRLAADDVPAPLSRTPPWLSKGPAGPPG